MFFLVERVETEEALNFLSHKNCKYVVNMHKTPYCFVSVSAEVKVSDTVYLS